MNYIPPSHPYWHVRSLVERYPKIAAVSMSYYEYEPAKIAEKRRNWNISSKDFLDERNIIEIIEMAPLNCEVALNSEFLCHGGAICHLIMIDMSTGARAHLDKLRFFLGDQLFDEISWYGSGRSFHGYGSRLLSKDEWVRFMGLLLLANMPNVAPTVDPRWIGHRLLAGYAALRWTKNTKFYKALPARIE